MERVARIELANNPWQGFRLPLHHTRILIFKLNKNVHYIIILLISFFVTSANAEWDNWSSETKTLFVTSQLVITADWLTTRDAAKRNWPNGTYETNSILGRYPSTEKVDVYMIGLLVSNYYITDWLPEKYRGFYLGVRTVAHGAAVQNNLRLGWRLQF